MRNNNAVRIVLIGSLLSLGAGVAQAACQSGSSSGPGQWCPPNQMLFAQNNYAPGSMPPMNYSNRQMDMRPGSMTFGPTQQRRARRGAQQRAPYPGQQQYQQPYQQPYPCGLLFPFHSL